MKKIRLEPDNEKKLAALQARVPAKVSLGVLANLAIAAWPATLEDFYPKRRLFK